MSFVRVLCPPSSTHPSCAHLVPLCPPLCLPQLSALSGTKIPASSQGKQSWAGGDTCLAWTSEEQISSAARHGHKSLTKHFCADALLHWPASLSTLFPLPINWRQHQSVQGAQQPVPSLCVCVPSTGALTDPLAEPKEGCQKKLVLF